jgi:hypothetical protein
LGFRHTLASASVSLGAPASSIAAFPVFCGVSSSLAMPSAFRNALDGLRTSASFISLPNLRAYSVSSSPRIPAFASIVTSGTPPRFGSS